jgi:hypothetical protein
MKILILIAVIIILLTSCVFASQEGVLPLDTFTIKSEGIGESGPVVISGTMNNKNLFTGLTIKAFGKEFKISEENLKKIPEKPYNGIQLSYETGYKELGGKTVYIILQFGFTSGIKEKTLITVTEAGSVKIETIKN